MTAPTGPDDPTADDPIPIDPTPIEPEVTAEEVTAEEPVTAEPITAETATAETATAETPMFAAAPAAVATADDGTVRVQRWVVLALAAFAVGAIGFALGWIAAPGDGDGGDRAAVTIESPRDLRQFFGPNGPFGDQRGSDGGGGSSGEERAPRAEGAFLGVVTRVATDPDGARIERILDDSPAEDADLETGDVITKVDDDEVDGPSALASAIGEHDPDDEVTITYVRDGETATARVTLADRASADLQAPGRPSFDF